MSRARRAPVAYVLQRDVPMLRASRYLQTIGCTRGLAFAARFATALSRYDSGARVDARAALRSPSFWAALGLLLLNDHVLKGAGLLPGVVTGKLSDFAGLVVAPLFVAALFGARRRAMLTAAIAIVVVPFAAIKLSSSAADALVAALRLVGLRWRIWSDPTDLVALAALPCAWRLAVTRAERPGRLVERAAMALAAVACVATSREGPEPAASQWTTEAFVTNSSDGAVDVRVRYLEGTVDCQALDDQGAERMLAPDTFGEGISFTLEAGDTVPISRPDVFDAAGLAQPSDGPPDDLEGCEVVLLQASAMPDVLVWWRRIELTTVPVPLRIEDDEAILPRDAGRFDLLRDEQGRLDVIPRGVGRSAAALASIEPGNCPSGPSYQWSSAPFEDQLIAPLEAIAALPDGCVDLRFGEPISATITACIPLDAFPFVSGDVLTVQANETWLWLEAEDGRQLTAQTVTSPGELGLEGEIAADDCAGKRLSCGAYVLSASWQLPDGARMAPGSETMTVDFYGREVRVLFGRAEQVLMARDGCEAVHAELGTFAQMVRIYGGAR